MALSGVPHDSNELAGAMDRLLGSSLATGERTHVVVRRDAPVRRLGLAVEPWPGLAAWVREERLDALVLHRPWRLPLDGLPGALGVLATHAPFEERLGLGWNPALAEQLELERTAPLGNQSGGPAGMTGELAPVPWRALHGRVAAVFGVVADTFGAPADPDQTIERVALAPVITPDLTGEAARAGARAFVSAEVRASARAALLATGVAAIIVGRARAERWSLGLLGRMLAREWPDLTIDLAPITALRDAS